MDAMAIILAATVSFLFFFVFEWFKSKTEKIELKNELKRHEERHFSTLNSLEAAKQNIQTLSLEVRRVNSENETLKQQLALSREKEKDYSIQVAKLETQLNNVQSQLTLSNNGQDQLPSLIVEQNQHLKQMFGIIARLQNDVINAQMETIDAHRGKGALENIGKGLDQIASKIRDWF